MPGCDQRVFHRPRRAGTVIGMAGKYLLTTLGCKVNQYESQQIRELLESLGMRAAGNGEVPDIAVVNTCAVTSEASRKSRQALRRMARRGCTSVVAVGCAASEDAERLRKLDSVVAAIGHHADICPELRKLVVRKRAHSSSGPTHDRDSQAETTPERPDAGRDDVWMNPFVSGLRDRPSASGTANPSIPILPRPSSVVKIEDPLTTRIESFAGHQRAFLKVQDGCNARCTYCIIPRLRPRLRSKPIEAAVAEVRGLVRAGHKEIVVTGIFLGAYGRETTGGKRSAGQRSPLVRLIEALAKVEGLERLRLSSLEPGDVNDVLLEVVTRHENCVPHLHLPLQSGSEKVLRRMNRQYTRDAFIEMVDRVRSALDRPAITTDIIVGFPGEAEEDFRASLEVARHAMFAKIHAFPFSPRDRTAAARWKEDFVDPAETRERMRRLAEVERECSLAFRRCFIGRLERVIVERGEDTNDEALPWAPIHHGRSDRYFEVRFEAEEVRPGDLVSVRIDRVTPTRTHGTYMNRGVDRSPSPVGSTAVA